MSASFNDTSPMTDDDTGLKKDTLRTAFSAPDKDGREPFAKGRLVPNDRGLDSSAEIAKRFGVKFDRNETARRSQELAIRYFKDIVSVLPEYTKGIDIEQGSRSSLQAFIEPYQQTSWIFIDERLDLFMFSLNFLTNYRACYESARDHDEETKGYMRRSLALGASKELGADQIGIRDDVGSLFEDHYEILPAVNALNVSMIVFTMCHEIAHHHLGHTSLKAEPAQELEADRLAYQLFTAVCEQRHALSNAQVDISTLSAPCLMLHYFRGMTIQLIGADVETRHHPKFSDRIAQLYRLGSRGWSELAKQKHSELTYQFDFLAGQLDTLAQ